MNDAPSGQRAAVHFSQVEPFLLEFKQRGPNVEPIVRMCGEYRPVRVKLNGEERALPHREVHVRASYLRKVGDVLLIVSLDTYVGEWWGHGQPMDAETDKRRTQVLDQLQEAVRAKDNGRGKYQLVDGCDYT